MSGIGITLSPDATPTPGIHFQQLPFFYPPKFQAITADILSYFRGFASLPNPERKFDLVLLDARPAPSSPTPPVLLLWQFAFGLTYVRPGGAMVVHLQDLDHDPAHALLCILHALAHEGVSAYRPLPADTPGRVPPGQYRDWYRHEPRPDHGGRDGGAGSQPDRVRSGWGQYYVVAKGLCADAGTQHLRDAYVERLTALVGKLDSAGPDGRQGWLVPSDLHFVERPNGLPSVRRY